MDVVGVQRADGDDLLDLDDRDLAGGGHHRVEVAGRLAEDQIAALVGLPGLDDGQVGDQAGFHHIVAAVEVAHFLAFGDQGADAGGGEEGGDARAACADAFGQGALGVELQLQLAGQILAFELLVLADVGRDHLGDLLGLQQLAQAEAVHACVVGDDGQSLDARGLQPGDQVLGNAAQAEAAGHDGHPVKGQALQRGRDVSVDLAHRSPFFTV
ncbi:hypothetical protein D3C71_1566390 [compost metagenome]